MFKYLLFVINKTVYKFKIGKIQSTICEFLFRFHFFFSFALEFA